MLSFNNQGDRRVDLPSLSSLRRIHQSVSSSTTCQDWGKQREEPMWEKMSNRPVSSCTLRSRLNAVPRDVPRMLPDISRKPEQARYPKHVETMKYS